MGVEDAARVWGSGFELSGPVAEYKLLHESSERTPMPSPSSRAAPAPLLLTESDVRAVLRMEDLIQTMERALAQFSMGEVRQPLRSVLHMGSEGEFLATMPAYIAEPKALGTKLVTLVGTNRARGLPTHLATILLLDPVTGALLSVMDGRYITETRTGAVSAVATRHLARQNGPASLGILGSGVQARSHVEALLRVRPVRDVRVWSPSQAHRTEFAVEMSRGRNISVLAVSTAEDAVRDADVIVLATSSTQPVLRSEWVMSGAHVISVGACRPDQREMDPDLVSRGRLFVDSREGALAEAGDVVIGIAEGRFGPTHVMGELGELVNGRVAGRVSDAEVTIFKSLGMAVEDVAAAELVYRCARERQVGRTWSSDR